MKRTMVLSILVALLSAVACQPTPPPAWTAPTIVDISVEPEPVVAGEPFTVTVTAHDDQIVDLVRMAIRPPYLIAGVDDPYSNVVCDDPPATSAATVTITFTCTMADFSPNGTWRLTVNVYNRLDPRFSAEETVGFELVGGSEDRQRPLVESYAFTPDPIVRGEPYSLVVRITDEHVAPPKPIYMNLRDIVDHSLPPPQISVAWPCGTSTPSIVSPTEIELRWDGCVVGPDAKLGRYRTSLFPFVVDLIGHVAPTSLEVDVVSA